MKFERFPLFIVPKLSKWRIKLSTYVISDIHGNYDAYMEILKKIHFSDEDMLLSLIHI